MSKAHLMTSKNAPKTIFCDIDGTLVIHPGSNNNHEELPKSKHKLQVLKGTLKKLWEWDSKGYRIILTTGRKESMRPKTEKELLRLGIVYDKLIMGLGGGVRILINDRKPNSDIDTAYAINLNRNEGIKNVKI